LCGFDRILSQEVDLESGIGDLESGRGFYEDLESRSGS